MGAHAPHIETLDALLTHAQRIVSATGERDALERLALALDDLAIAFHDATLIDGVHTRSHASPAIAPPAHAEPSTDGTDDRSIALRTVEGTRIGRIRLAAGLAPADLRIANLLADTCARTIEALRRHDAQHMETVGRLVEGVAHDYNNLLTVIQGHAELAQHALDTSHPAIASVRSVEHAVEHARGIVASLLDLTARAECRHETIDFCDLLRRAAPLLETLTPSRVRVRVRVPDEPCQIRGSTSRLRQLLVNLALNARDAMPAGGTISLTLERSCDPPRARLIVADTGLGMSDETLARALDPRFTTKPDGRGLGLSIVREIVAEHAGTMDIVSAPAQGCSISIDLPIACMGERRAPGAGPRLPASPAHPAAA